MNKLSLLIISGIFCSPVFFHEQHIVQFVNVHSINHQGFIQSPDIKASIARGEKIYQAGCISCHQVNGTGVPGMNPPLKETSYVKGDKQVLINVVLKGLKEKDIDDESYSNSMPSQRQLTDQQIADVLTYVRSSFGNKSSAVLSSEVKAIRNK